MVEDTRKRGLGRGLNALFGDDEQGTSLATDASGAVPSRKMIGLHQIVPGQYQPRTVFDESAIAELAESLKNHGLLQPILVRPKKGKADQYEIVAGERRWRAAQKANLHEIPVIIKELDDKTALEIALIENLQRKDLNPVEEAVAISRLAKEFGHTQEKLAEALGKSRSHIANILRLLDLPESVQNMISDGALTAGHARALVTADDPEFLARQILEGGLTVRAAENLAREAKIAPSSPKSAAKKSKDVNTSALEDELSNALGLKVTIDMKNGRGGGKVSIDFRTLDQLDDVVQRLTAVSQRLRA